MSLNHANVKEARLRYSLLESSRQWDEYSWKQDCEEYNDWLTVGWGVFTQVMYDVRGEQDWEIVMARPTTAYRENAKG